MEKLPQNVFEPTTPMTKTNLQVRIVSNKDKENVSPDVFLSPLDHSAFTRSDSQENSIFISVDPIPKEMLNPFLAEFQRISHLKETSVLGNSETFSDTNADLKKTDSIMTADSLGSELSSISLNNKRKGYKIPSHQEHRVFSDITSLHVTPRKMSDLVSYQNDLGIEESHSNLQSQNNVEFQRRSLIPVHKKSLQLNKENKFKNIIKPLLKYKNHPKRKSKLGIRRANNRRSMRI